VRFQTHDGVHFPLWIFFARTIDRFGKGLRTGARDAMLSDEATPRTKGKIFGFHRSMDTMGAVLGPSPTPYFYPENYTTLFYIAFIPDFLYPLPFVKRKERFQEKRKQLLFSFWAIGK
jgi:MFS family permease